jgi:hypothetical protein
VRFLFPKGEEKMKKIRNENGLFGKKTMVMRWVFTIIVATLAITIFWMIEPTSKDIDKRDALSIRCIKD